MSKRSKKYTFKPLTVTERIDEMYINFADTEWRLQLPYLAKLARKIILEAQNSSNFDLDSIVDSLDKLLELTDTSSKKGIIVKMIMQNELDILSSKDRHYHLKSDKTSVQLLLTTLSAIHSLLKNRSMNFEVLDIDQLKNSDSLAEVLGDYIQLHKVWYGDIAKALVALLVQKTTPSSSEKTDAAVSPTLAQVGFFNSFASAIVNSPISIANFAELSPLSFFKGETKVTPSASKNDHVLHPPILSNSVNFRKVAPCV